MGFPRQEHWRGLPFPTPRDLPNPGIKPALQADSSPMEPLGSPYTYLIMYCMSHVTNSCHVTHWVILQRRNKSAKVSYKCFLWAYRTCHNNVNPALSLHTLPKWISVTWRNTKISLQIPAPPSLTYRTWAEDLAPGVNWDSQSGDPTE